MKGQLFDSAGSCSAVDDRGVKIGTVHSLLRKHLKYCVACPRYYDEISRWQWDAERMVELVDEEMTGEEMYDEIKSDSMG